MATPAEEALAAQVGDIGGSDYIGLRENMLIPLLRNGVITIEEFDDVIMWSNVDDPPEIIYGYVAGHFDKTPNEIAAGLEGSRFDSFNTADIEVMERGYVAAYQDIVGRPFDVLEQAYRGVKRLPGAITDFSGRNLVSPEEQEENRTRLDGIKRDQPKLQAWLDSVIAGGDVGAKEAEEYRKTIEEWSAFDSVRGESSTTYDDPIWQMIEKFEADGWTMPSGMETTPLQDIIDERDTAATEVADQAYMKRGYLPEDERAALEAERGAYSAASEFNYSDYSFSEIMTQLGLKVAEVKSTIAQGEAEGFGLLAEGYDFSDEGVIFDRASGIALSRDIYQILQHDAQARAAYTATAPTSPALQELFDSGNFNVGRRPMYDAEGRVRRNAEGDIQYNYFEMPTPGYNNTSNKFFPIEDFEVPTGVADDSWEREFFLYGNQQDQDFEWFGMSPRSQNLWMDQMVNNGLIDENQANLPYDDDVRDVWRTVSDMSEYRQLPRGTVLDDWGDSLAAQRARQPRGGGSGRIAPKYSVPASLREIPDYKTLATQSRALFSQELGREMEDWELALLSDELKGKYVDEQTSKQEIHKQAWDDALAGGSVSVDFTEVTNPLQAQQYDTRETYAGELDRQVRVEDRANNNRLMMNSVTVGSRMI